MQSVYASLTSKALPANLTSEQRWLMIERQIRPMFAEWSKLEVGEKAKENEESDEDYQDESDIGEEYEEGEEEEEGDEGEEGEEGDEGDEEDEEEEDEGEEDEEDQPQDEDEQQESDFENYMEQMEKMENIDLEADEEEVPESRPKDDFIEDIEDMFDSLAYGVHDKNIKRIEKQLVGNKAWQLKGEVRAVDRPVNALLDTEVDFDVGLQSKVVISRELNQRFEELIKQRIADFAFDDREMPVVSKLRVKEQTNQFQDIDFEKDTRGLAGVYEDEYKKTVLGKDPAQSKTDRLKQEITGLFKNICFCIDGMSRGAFTPNSVRLDGANRPEGQITVDEKIPVFVTSNIVESEKALREVHAPQKGDFKSAAEATKTERKALRRKIKEARHRISQRVKEENRVKSGISVRDSKLLERNKAKVRKQIDDSGVGLQRGVRPSNFFSTLEGLKRVKQQ